MQFDNKIRYGAPDLTPFSHPPYAHPMLPYISEPTMLYGSRWQTLNPDCQLENLIQPILLGNASSTEPPARLLVFGDSTGELMATYLHLELFPMHDPFCSIYRREVTIIIYSSVVFGGERQ